MSRLDGRMDLKKTSLLPVERVGQKIIVIRGQRVMLDVDLAGLYGVTAGSLNQAVRRQTARFPSDFMFQLTPEEYAILKSQSVISRGWGGRDFYHSHSPSKV